jgi:hypothetical protein
MKYSEDFEREINEIEDTAIHLANCEEVGQVDIQQRNQFVIQLDHIINTFDIECETVLIHTDEVKRIWKTRENTNTAEKHIATVHQAFLAEVCDDYDPQY